ncbi:AAA family ATPase, partial [Oleiphilus sp. HI0117]
ADPSMGELTTQVYCYPKTVILFDEIEKAHPQIIQSLLAILDRGLCQDSTSFKWVDFSQTFILFTTNLGSEELSQRRESGQVFGTLDTTSLGGLLRQDKNNSDKGLSPEFVNRLSKGHLLVFESLCPEHLLDIYKSSWKRCSSEISTLAVDTPDCSTELATINLLKRLPDLSARTANSAAESDIVDCLEPILECYENSSLPGEEFYISVKVSGLEDVLNSLMADRGLDNPETVLIVDDDDRTEAQIIQGCAKAGLPIRHKRIAHEMSSQIVSKELRPDLILIDLFIEDDVAQLKSTTALSLIMELRNRFLDVPIVAFCRDPGRAKVTEKAIKAAKSIDGITAVLTYQSKRPEDFINEVTLMLKKRRLARLVQAVVRERKRLQFDWRAKAKTDHITLETILTRLEPIITPGDEGQMSGLGEIPDLKFSDIVGNERGVRQISRAIGWLQHPGRIGRFGFRPPGGYLLAGPPGTGKTFLARAAAGECGLPFFSINSAELLSPGAGVAESKLRDLFANARRLAPSIIFIDEIDAIGQQRRSGDYHGIVNTLLGEMDGFSG